MSSSTNYTGTSGASGWAGVDVVEVDADGKPIVNQARGHAARQAASSSTGTSACARAS